MGNEKTFFKYPCSAKSLMFIEIWFFGFTNTDFVSITESLERGGSAKDFYNNERTHIWQTPINSLAK